ncbi:MAG TPA: DUF1192 family protein [Vicinamibacteria bacterium]|nr:DUF1192 family protein [Vicinamibacteria bacterium]
MDEARIRALAEEVLRDLRSPAPVRPGDLESRVAALEAEVARLRQERARPPALEAAAVHVHVQTPPGGEGTAAGHPSQLRLGPGVREGHCVMEPDRPCVHSGQCRSFGF